MRSRWRSVLDLSNLTRTSLLECRRNYFAVLGIETSCDDTCAAVVDFRGKVLSSRRCSDMSQDVVGGVSPFLAAQRHRRSLDRFVEDCLDESGLRAADLAGVAVSTEPGLVICLKVGVDKALALYFRLPFLPVHHMRAHALVARLVYADLEFPFVALLVSGGHALICVANGPDDFEILGQALEASPGESFDKIGRALHLKPSPHYGSELERMAGLYDMSEPLKYLQQLPHTSGAMMNFRTTRDRFVTILSKRQDVDVPAFSFNVQHLITGHLCQKLDVALHFLSGRPSPPQRLVLSGGVAANSYVRAAVGKVARHWGLEVFLPPKQLVTDNAEMVAWAGVEKLNAGSADILPYGRLPTYYYTGHKSPIGKDIAEQVQMSDCPRKLRISSLLPSSGRLSFAERRPDQKSKSIKLTSTGGSGLK